MQIYEFDSKYQKLGYKELTKDEVLEFYKTSDLDEKDRSTQNGLLHTAAFYAHSEAIEYLLEKGIDANVENSYGQRPLHLLAKENRDYTKQSDDIIKSTKILLENKASTMRKDDEGKTAVIEAAYSGCYEMLKVMVEKEVKLTMTDKNGNDALSVACKNVSRAYDEDTENYYKIIQLLLDAGFDPYAKNNYDKTAIDIANEAGDKKAANLLQGISENDNSAKTGGMNLFKAIEEKDYEAIKANLEMGCDINEVSDESGDFKGMTPLAIACYLLDLESVKILLNFKADVNYKNSTGESAINKWLSYLGDMHLEYEKLNNKIIQQIFELLIKNGLNVNDTIDDKGNTAIIKAASAINKNQAINGETLSGIVMKLLLKNNCDVNLTNLEGQSALMLLCSSSMKETDDIRVEILEMDAKVDEVDKYGNTPLIYAAKNTDNLTAKEVAELLFDFGNPKLEHINNEGKSAIEIATENNNEELVKFLLMKG